MRSDKISASCNVNQNCKWKGKGKEDRLKTGTEQGILDGRMVAGVEHPRKELWCRMCNFPPLNPNPGNTRVSKATVVLVYKAMQLSPTQYGNVYVRPLRVYVRPLP